jgi:hypothetical protein
LEQLLVLMRDLQDLLLKVLLVPPPVHLHLHKQGALQQLLLLLFLLLLVPVLGALWWPAQKGRGAPWLVLLL